MPRRSKINKPEDMTKEILDIICGAYERYLGSLNHWPWWKKLNHDRQHEVCFDSLKSLLEKLEELEKLDEAAQNNEQQATYVDLWFFLVYLYSYMGNNKSLLPSMILDYFNEAFFDQGKGEGRIEKYAYDGTTAIDPPDVSREMLKKLKEMLAKLPVLPPPPPPTSGKCPNCRDPDVLTSDLTCSNSPSGGYKDVCPITLDEPSESSGGWARVPCCKKWFKREPLLMAWSFQKKQREGDFRFARLLPMRGVAPRAGVPQAAAAAEVVVAP